MTKFIAIDGRGGSGKTYLSEQLAAHLDATVFHLDKYGSDFVPFIGLPILNAFVRRCDADVVIYEGVGVFDTRFDDLEAYKIFVDTPESLRAARVEGRDVPREDRTAEDWEFIAKVWSDAEKAYITNSLRERADIVVGSDGGAIDVAALVEAIVKQRSY